MAELHGQYLGVFCPTDVMSFPARSEGSQSDEGRGEDRAPDIQGGPGEGYLGDIAISEETAQAQALEYGHSAEREIALLVVHGALHLIGYDDQDPGAESVMRDMEKKALELLWGGTAGSGCQGPA
jgi:probable rRNA maturation factor